MCLRLFLWGMSLAYGLSSLGTACEISVRDQVLLITISEAAPAAGMTDIASMAGAEIECAPLGSFRVVRYQGRGMYVLDPSRAFNRWGQTGASFTGGPLLALKSYVDVYRLSHLTSLWQLYGRGGFTELEVSSMSITEGAELPWKRIRLMNAASYRSAVVERASAEEEQVVHLLLFEKARSYVTANEPAAVRVVEISPGQILKYSGEAVVTVSYREKQGATKSMVLRVPINPTMVPYVGYPIKEETDIRKLRRLFNR